MDYDDEFDEGNDDALEYEDSAYDTPESRGVIDEGESQNGFDPLDITNPVSAYFFLSDDVQDEIQGSGKRKMKCLSCGHRFMGEISDICPECYSSNTEESEYGSNELDGEARPNMKCLTCGYKFIGDIYDDCPECFSGNIEKIDEQDHLDPSGE